MKKSNRATGQRRRGSSKLGIRSFGLWLAPSSRETVLRVRPRWLLVIVAALGCSLLLAVRNGAEQVDSGWAVATPSPLGNGSTTTTNEQQLVIRHVLEQNQQPLLQKATPAKAAPAQATPAQTAKPITKQTPASARYAARPEVNNGWRP